MVHNIGDRKQVFVDWSLVEAGYGVALSGSPTSWEMPAGVKLSVHPPRMIPEPMVTADRPWEAFVNAYATLFEDSGRFRLYYECYAPRPHGDASPALLAYAESADGVHWDKPSIGIYGLDGSTDNNIVFGPSIAHGRAAAEACVFVDPAATPDQRYKLVHTAPVNGEHCLLGAVSPDGLHWTGLARPLLAGYHCDTQNVVHYDVERGRYVGYVRGWRQGRRAISYAETDDFAVWPLPEIIVETDAGDNPDADVYTNGYTRWPGVAGVHLMFPTFYQRCKDTLEVHMMTSGDGRRWSRPMRAPIIACGEPGTDAQGGVYAGCGIAALQAGEWSLPVAPKWHTHNQGRFSQGQPATPPNRGCIHRACWRQDGFMSLEAESEGKCTTVPVTFSGSRLLLNAWTRFGGEIAVELATADGTALPGFTFADCDPFSGDSLQHTVIWQGQRDVSAWAGVPVRLRLRLRRARLYAWQFM